MMHAACIHAPHAWSAACPPRPIAYRFAGRRLAFRPRCAPDAGASTARRQASSARAHTYARESERASG
eukprot:5223012-Alexandrium_andersonii.AAC.1